MAHDPSFGFADYLSAADAAATSTLMPAMDNGAPPELYGLQTSMELLGMHPAMPGAASAASAAHCDGSGDPGESTMRFFLEQQQHQNQQAPLSLSLQHHQQQQHAPVSAWMVHEQDAAAHGHGAAWHLRSSRFLFPAQQLLEGFCSLPVDTKAKRTKAAAQQQQEDAGGGGGEGSSSSSSCRAPSAQIQAMDALELQRLKDKLYIMLEEVDRRYRRYCEQMRGLAGGFEAVAGERAAAGYTALASRTISRHFRSLRDGVVAQLQAVRKALGEKDSSSSKSPGGMTRGDTPRLKVLDQCIRQHKAMHQNGGLLMETHPWRPQRGLPERAVTVLRAWLFEHFLHPYPSDVDKHILSRQTGLSRSQVSNWFINARVRLWKPMVEEMYVEEMKDDGGAQGHEGQVVVDASAANNNPSSGSNQLVQGDGGEQKPTRAQLRHADADADIGVAAHGRHDAGSLASVVNVGRMGMESFADMDGHGHFGFDAYDTADADAGPSAGFGGGGGVSLTLGLQQHDSRGDHGGVNIAFGAPGPAHGGYLFPGDHQQQMGMLHTSAGHGHHIQFGAGGGMADSSAGDASNGAGHVDAQQYRWLSAAGSSSLLRDMTG